MRKWYANAIYIDNIATIFTMSLNNARSDRKNYQAKIVMNNDRSDRKNYQAKIVITKPAKLFILQKARRSEKTFTEKKMETT